MNFVMILLCAVAVGIVLRIFFNVRKARRRQAQDWDTRLIAQLRARGSDPFQPHGVDFFFALPDHEACAAINQKLEAEGFRVDVKAVPENTEFPFSLHAAKTMRVHATEMRELSRRFGELANEHRGRYDGWGSD
jgi:hypothetical protein